MKALQTVLTVAAGFYLLVYIILAICTKKPIRTIFYNAVFGIIALFAVGLTRNYTGFYIPINLFSVCISSAGGIAGVVLLLLLRFIMG